MKRSSRTIPAAAALACVLAAPGALAADLLVCSTTLQGNFAGLKQPDAKLKCYEPATDKRSSLTLRELHEQGWRPTVATSATDAEGIQLQFMSFWERPDTAPATQH